MRFIGNVKIKNHLSNLGIMLYLQAQKNFFSYHYTNNIIGEFGTPEKHADVFLENKMKDKPETIRKRLVFHRVIAIAAVLVVAIIGIVYACALIENHKDANGRTADTIEYYENIEEIG